MLISALQHKSNSISNFKKKKNQIFGSHVVASTREDLSVDVSITYGNSGYGQNSISLISNFLQKIHIFGFTW